MTEATLESDIRNSLIDGTLPCERAHRIATDLDLSPLAVGAAVDRLGLRISRCQLGLFGYAEFGAKRASVDVETIPDRVATALADANRPEGVPCKAAWDVAAEQGLPRLLIGSVADRLEVRIAPCQLGCF